MTDDKPQSPFSLIADFEGDIRNLFNTPVEGTLPILPLRNMMLFPGVVAPVAVGRESSLKLIEQASKNDGMIGVATQRSVDTENPKTEDLFPIGVVARVMRTLEMPDGTITAIIQGNGPFELNGFTRTKPFLRGKISSLQEIAPDANDKEFNVMVDACRDLTVRYVKLSDQMRDEAAFAIRNITHPVFLINFVCTNLPISIEEKAELMNERDVKLRAHKLMTILGRECQYEEMKENIQAQTREELDKQQKEYFLQQQIRNIKSELGETEAGDASNLRAEADAKNLPKKAREIFDRELLKLERLNQQNPDYNVQLNYLQTIVSLPWGMRTEDNMSIRHARQTLDTDHYGMEKVKERILEHLASLKMSHGMKSPILCLYGPPGVGKTSLGKSIAKSLGRKYVRISLGGVHDEAEIRGHRRTYIGAMPGRIVKSMIKAESENPVFVLDEIDKLSENNYNGDPQSALLEVLDPEQNSTFHDNFLDMDYDLSNVFFIATANNLGSIPRPLLDRMEIIEVEGYLTEEKKEIGRRHLLPRHLKQYLPIIADGVRIPAKTMEFIIEKYTRESGVRQLEKQIEKLLRKISLHYALDDDNAYAKPLTPANVEELLGKPLFNRDIYQGNEYAGVVTGLAWTSVGGEILFIETAVSRSKHPRLTLTGNLGEVMKESAMIALEYIKSHAEDLSIDYRIFEGWNIHIHVPEGATPKDGPSAGITIATSIASALTQRKVRKSVAMTGEITLRGKVLPVGGIKEKILAAKRAGIRSIIMSKENKKDVEEIHARYVENIDFHYVDNVRDVLDYALLKEKVKGAIDLTVDSPVNSDSIN